MLFVCKKGCRNAHGRAFRQPSFYLLVMTIAIKIICNTINRSASVGDQVTIFEPVPSTINVLPTVLLNGTAVVSPVPGVACFEPTNEVVAVAVNVECAFLTVGLPAGQHLV